MGGHRRQTRDAGFTLVEVMIALTIAALGLAAIAVSLQQNIATAARLRDRTMALYIASNTIAELRLNAAFPDVGRSTDEVDFGDREWLVVTTVQESGIEGLRRTDVAVADSTQPDLIIRTTTGFVAQRAALPSAAKPSFSTGVERLGESN